MPDNEDNIVKFRPKGGKSSADKAAPTPEQQAKAAMLARLAAGSKRLRQKVRHEHILYYSILLTFAVVCVLLIINQVV